jgi:hypothetical protein
LSERKCKGACNIGTLLNSLKLVEYLLDGFQSYTKNILSENCQLPVPVSSFIALKKPTRTKAHPRLGITGGSAKNYLSNKVCKGKVKGSPVTGPGGPMG